MKRFSVFQAVASFILAVAFAFSFSAFTDNYSPDSGSAIGTRTIMYQQTADTVTSSTTEVATELTTPIAANQKIHIRYYVPITLGGTAPGIKFLVNAPASPIDYKSGVTIFADDDSVALVSQIASEAAQGVTLANAGSHIAIIDFTMTNGANAGNVTLEFAQNVSDAAATIVQSGAVAEITKF
jgi:hypothetical protein